MNLLDWLDEVEDLLELKKETKLYLIRHKCQFLPLKTKSMPTC